MRIYLEYSDGKSNKFWEGVVEGVTLTTRWGRVGAAGQSKSQALGDEAAAAAELDKKAKAKIKKGYAKLESTTPKASGRAAKKKPALAVTPHRVRATPIKLVGETLEPIELVGETIRLSDYARFYAFGADGTRLACMGISSVHVVDVGKREWKTSATSREAAALHWVGETLVVGTTSISVLDGDTGKKLLAMKGHRAPALALVSDGRRLYTGGGNFVQTHDRFVRAFDLETGELVWKVKPGKGSGALSLALVGEWVCVAAEDGHVRVFDADDGAALGELELGPAQPYGSIFGGVVACGDRMIAAATEVDCACEVNWIEVDPEPRLVATTTIALAKINRREGCSIGVPMTCLGRVLVPIYYCVGGSPRVVLAELDVASRALRSMRLLVGLEESSSCALSVDGTLAWSVTEGVALASLVEGETSKKPRKKKTSKKKTSKKKTSKKKASKKKTEAAGPGQAIGVTPGGPERRACHAGTLVEEPTIVWARADFNAGAGEFGGSVSVGEGLALGAYGETITACAAETGGALWSTKCATSRTYATSGIAIADGTVFMATNQGLHAFAAEGGEPLWKARLPGAVGAPLVFEDLCIIGANKGLHARSLAKKGRKVWTFELKDRVHGAPAYADGVLYFYADASLFAVEAATRELLWVLPAMAPPRSQPVVSGELVLYMPAIGSLAAVDRRTGESRWQTKSPRHMGNSPFAVSDDWVVFKNGEGLFQAHRLATGEREWTSSGGREDPYGIGYAGPIIVGDTVVCVTVERDAVRRYLTGLDLADGKVRWDLDNVGVEREIAAEQKRTGSSFTGDWSWYCTPVFVEETLYAQTNAGIVALRCL